MYGSTYHLDLQTSQYQGHSLNQNQITLATRWNTLVSTMQWHARAYYTINVLQLVDNYPPHCTAIGSL